MLINCECILCIIFFHLWPAMLDPTLTCEPLTLSFVQSPQVACRFNHNSIPRSDSKSWNLTWHQQWKTQFLHRIFRLTLFVRAKHVSPESGTPDKEFYPRTYVEVNPPSRRVRVQRVLFFLLTITLTLSLKGQGKANTKSPVLSAVHHSWLDLCNRVSLYFVQHSTCFYA